MDDNAPSLSVDTFIPGLIAPDGRGSLFADQQIRPYGSATRVVLVQISPEMARTWLEQHNSKNRPMSSVAVTRLRDAILRGEWELTHQGIAFDEAGLLLDGQHRLKAIEMSGMTVPCYVTYGVAREAMTAIDTGRKRSIGDVVGIIGHGDSNTLAAAATIVWRYETDKWRGVARPTAEEVLRIIDNHKSLPDWIAAGRRIGKATGLLRSVATGMTYLVSRSGTDLGPWIDGLVTGAHMSPQDPCLVLRNTIQRRRMNGRSASTRWLCGVYAKAFVAWLDDHQITLLKFLDSEPMPLIPGAWRAEKDS